MLPARLVIRLADLHARLRYRRLVKTFRDTLGYTPSIACPRSYNEKFLWRKIFDRNPLFATFCDKLACKDYVAARAPDIAILPALWTGTCVDDIPDEVLQGDVVIKQNNASSSNIFVRNGAYDRAELRRTVAKWRKGTYGRRKGEWGYSQVPTTLFVEPILPSSEASPIVDLNFICSDGTVQFVIVSTGIKTDNWRLGFFDAQGRPSGVHAEVKGPEEDRLPPGFRLPDVFAEAKAIAERLSTGLDHVRCDMLVSGEQLYFGEMTVYAGSGLTQYSDPAQLAPTNASWDLRKSWFLTAPQTGWRGIYAAALRRRLDERAADGDGR